MSMGTMGQVILVGAGPGDPELLTIKGKRALENAEVVVYDRLVSPAIFQMIPENAEKIDVGKRSSHHTVPQEEINQILLRKALEGKRVVRLKGGDPFLFGRGGEELELLRENNVPFEEVPGITSAIAVPAYGGIPVTHRDCCSSLHIITGHQRAGKPLSIPFQALKDTEGTLVFLMGVSALEEICNGLLQAGMEGSMPAAVVEKGTTPRQRTILATLETLPQKAREEQVESPAIIIVGKVCAYAAQFNWFDSLPLKGKSVIVTRPKERAGTLSKGLRELGADVTEFPCIETHPISPCPDLDDALKTLAAYGWLAFTSPAGVKIFMEKLFSSGKDARALAGVKLAAIGTGTAGELKKWGLTADLIPAIYDGEHLALALCDAAQGETVLIPRAKEGNPRLTEILEEHGVSFREILCYETRYPQAEGEKIKPLLQSGTVVTFTSASTVKGFIRALGEDTDCSSILAACIGKQTEREAKAHGLSTITAQEATIGSLIQRIKEGV